MDVREILVAWTTAIEWRMVRVWASFNGDGLDMGERVHKKREA